MHLLLPCPRTFFSALLCNSSFKTSLATTTRRGSFPGPHRLGQMPLYGLSLIPAPSHRVMTDCSSHQRRRWRARPMYSRSLVSCNCSELHREGLMAWGIYNNGRTPYLLRARGCTTQPANIGSHVCSTPREVGSILPVVEGRQRRLKYQETYSQSH